MPGQAAGTRMSLWEERGGLVSALPAKTKEGWGVAGSGDVAWCDGGRVHELVRMLVALTGTLAVTDVQAVLGEEGGGAWVEALARLALAEGEGVGGGAVEILRVVAAASGGRAPASAQGGLGSQAGAWLHSLARGVGGGGGVQREVGRLGRCVCVFVCLCVCVCVCVCVSLRMYVLLCVCMHMYACMHACVHACMYVSMGHTCIHKYIHTFMQGCGVVTGGGGGAGGSAGTRRVGVAEGRERCHPSDGGAGEACTAAGAGEPGAHARGESVLV